MNSPKPPLQQLVYQGSPGKNLLFQKDSSTSHSTSRQTSENCDPNLDKFNVPGGSSVVLRKYHTSADAATSTLEDKPKDLARKDQVDSSEARQEVTAGAEDEHNTSKEKDIPHRFGASDGSQQFKSPTKPASATSPGGGHGHSHRQHFCRSPRCASNNPDYATPAHIPPRKYLISKRHLLPGAICTRDPSTLPSSQIPLPPSSATGKPPARPPPSSASKDPTTNTFRQLSFKDASSDMSKSGPAGKGANCSLLDTDSGGLVTEAAAACGSTSLIPDELALFKNDEQNGVITAYDTQLQEQQQQDVMDQEQPVSCDCNTADDGLYGEDQDVEQLRSHATTASGTQLQEQQQQQYDIDQMEAVKYVCNTGELRSSDEGQHGDQLRSCNNEGDCVPELNSGSESSSDVDAEHTASKSCVEDLIADSVSCLEANHCEYPGFATVDGKSSQSPASVVPPPVSANTPEEEPVSVASCESIDRHDFLSSIVANPPPGVDDVSETLEQTLAAEKMGVPTSPRCSSCCDDAVVDIYDLAAGASTSGSEGETGIKKDYTLGDCPTEDRRESGNCDCMDADVSTSETFRDDMEDETSRDCHKEENFDEYEGASRETETSFCKSSHEPGVQRAPPKFGRSKGRQLWRSDCRDSREVVTLRPTNHNTQDKDWMVDSLLEGAVNRLKPSGEGRVRLLVEAFESLMNITEPEQEKRPSRLWCLNRMGEGEVDDDGDLCEEGDQRVDCYEVSGDRLELRASMRLSLGGSSRHDTCGVVEDDEMSFMQRVQDWDDRQAPNPPESSDGKDIIGGDQDRNMGKSSREHGQTRAKSPSKGQTRMNDKDRKRAQMYNEVKKQLGYKTDDNVNMKIQRYNQPKGSLKSSSVKSDTESNLGSAEKSARGPRNTQLEPFRLLTEERGAFKEYQFAKKLQQLFADEERQRNPIAQGLPWTTDEAEIVPKPPVKQPTRHVDFTHYSDSRAASRAEFDNYIAEREMYMKMQREEEERRRQMAEQEEIKRLRREMVPRAQLMPFFDQPFMPSRSSKRLTIPKEPNFKTRQHKRAKCMVFQQGAT